MPRVIRDSDEEVETKISARRTRAAASSASITDSPARRTTRRNKQLTTTESSPESLDDSNAQPTVRTTRSRAATLEKFITAGIAKNLRSRKNSTSSNVSETIDLESEITQKRVTRKSTATASAVDTPTKTNLRLRNFRAGSEAKSTPPATRTTRVTRASSVDPINTPNASVGTPIKRCTRASMVPVQQTVTEEQEVKNKTPESLNNAVVEIDKDPENESVSTKDESNRKLSKNLKEIGKDSGTEQTNLDTSKLNEENMTDKSYTSNDSNGDSTLKAVTSHSITSKLESFTSRKKETPENINQRTVSESLVLSTDQNLIKSVVPLSNSNENNFCSINSKVDINDDEFEHVDVENLTLTDDSIDVLDSPKKVDTRDTLALDIKDSYVKLNRTNLVEIVSNKLEGNKNNDNNLPEKLNDSDNVSQSNVIANAKTAIVLVNDFVKSNEYFNSMKDQQIFDSGISLNNREDVNSNTSMHNSDDQSSIISVDDSEKVLTLKLPSPNEKETQNDKLIVEVLPDDEKNYFNKVTVESVSVNVNSDSKHNLSLRKSDVCLKENAMPESKLKSENLIDIGQKNNELESSGAVTVHNEIIKTAGEIGGDLISESIHKVDSFEMINASGNNVFILNSLHENMQHDDSVSVDIDADAIVSVNVKSPVIKMNLTATEFKNDIKSEVVQAPEFEIGVHDIISSTKSKVNSNENIITEKKNDSLHMNNAKAEKNNRLTGTNEQLKLMDASKFESNSKENRDITDPCVFNETSSHQIEPKLSLEDKNGVPSAVTDAGGENASSPCKEEEIHETSTDAISTKFSEKSKRKSKARVIESDLDESAENLFQDIPAEEWSKEPPKRKSNEFKRITEVGNSPDKLDCDSFNVNKSVVEESRNGEDHNSKTKKSRVSLDKGELDKSAVKIFNAANDTENQKVDLPLSNKARRSLENKRESGQSSDSGIQQSIKTAVESDADENDNRMNESLFNSRRSLDNSLKANQSFSVQDKNASVTEKLSKSLVDRKSSSKSRKSLNNSSQFNASVFNTFREKNDSLSSPLNTSNVARKQSSIDTRKSVAEEKIDKNSEAEVMEVDEEDVSNSETNRVSDSSNKSAKSFKNDQVGQFPTKNDSICEKSSVLLSASKIAKRLSADKTLNKSSAERTQEKEIVDEDEIDVDSKKSTKKRFSEKFNKSTRKSLTKEQNEKEESEHEEMEVDVVNDKSINKSRKSLNELSSNKSINQKGKLINNAVVQASSKNEDKSLKETSDRESDNMSLNLSDIAVDGDSESEVEADEDDEIVNKSTSESPEFASKFCVKDSIVEDAEKPGESMSEVSPKTKKGQEAKSVPSAIDCSLQKSIERMKFMNPPKHNISTVVQVNSSSEDDSDDSQIPKFMFKLSDEEDTKDSSDEEEEVENDVDSDIEKEYNLGGKSITKYSDDDVPGDDCRVSEEESSDSEDDRTDLQDFIVPDEEIDEDEDDEEDEDEESESESEDEDEAEHDDKEGAEVEGFRETEINLSKKNVSFNSSQSTVKNSSPLLRRSGFSQSSGSESDDEATEAENKNSQERCVEDSEKLLQDIKTKEQSNVKNASLIKKDKSADKCLKSIKSNVSYNSESNNEGTKNVSQRKAKEKSTNVHVKNKSLNLSKSTKDKSATTSKWNNDKSVVALNDSKSDSNKSVHVEDNDQTESSSTESDDYEDTSRASEDESMQIASPSEIESESEEGEDYYRVVNVDSRDASQLEPKKKKFIDCSTPKPGASKKTNFSKANLSTTAPRRKSGSLNDLTDTKIMSSRQSIDETAFTSMKLGDKSMKLKADVEIVATPETVTKTRQAWKLIPLNHTAHPVVEDTPGTKFLKKAKLNDSFPVLDSMKSSDLSSTAKKNNKATHKGPELEEVVPKEDNRKSKKRKLLDISNAQSVGDDSILKASKKNKKRARFDDSTTPATANKEEIESIERSIKNRNKKLCEKQATETERVEEVHKSKKKKKNKAEEVEVEEAPEEVEAKPKRKRKGKLSNAQEAPEEDQSAELEKPTKKKKSKVFEAVQVKNSSLKSKSKKHATGNSRDGAPQIVGDEEAPHLALNEIQRDLEGVEATKESLKKNRNDHADRTQKVKQIKSLKRLAEDVLENLTDEPLRRPDKRQKLSRNKERSVIMPSKSMFSPGKNTPENLRVDDHYIPLSSAGGTTQFAVVNLQKAKKVAKKSIAALNFREKMLARNKRMPMAIYLSNLKKQKAKSSL